MIFKKRKEKCMYYIVGSVPNLQEYHIRTSLSGSKIILDVNATFDWLHQLDLWFRNIYKLADVTFSVI